METSHQIWAGRFSHGATGTCLVMGWKVLMMMVLVVMVVMLLTVPCCPKPGGGWWRQGRRGM